MKLLVTGGAGFIGSNLVHYLLGPASAETAQDIDLVVNLDKLTYAGNLENLAPIAKDARHIFVQGDIMDTALVRQLLSDHKIDAIMHLAAESHVDRSIDAPEDFIQTNFVGTFRLLEAARDHARTHPGFRFLHVSTDEVFGTLKPEDPAFSETTPYAPNSAYSANRPYRVTNACAAPGSEVRGPIAQRPLSEAWPTRPPSKGATAESAPPCSRDASTE